MHNVHHLTILIFMFQLLANATEQEKKMREELARQALAHNNHLSEMLKLQQSQLVKEFNTQLNERIDFERSTYVDSLAKHIAKIEGLMGVIEGKGTSLSASFFLPLIDSFLFLIVLGVYVDVMFVY